MMNILKVSGIVPIIRDNTKRPAQIIIKYHILVYYYGMTISFQSGFGLVSLSLQVHQDDLMFSVLCVCVCV